MYGAGLSASPPRLRRSRAKRAKTRSDLDGLELVDLDARLQSACVAGVETTCPDLEGRCRARCDRGPQRLLGGAAAVPRGQVAGEEDVSRADRRDRLDLRS